MTGMRGALGLGSLQRPGIEVDAAPGACRRATMRDRRRRVTRGPRVAALGIVLLCALTAPTAFASTASARMSGTYRYPLALADGAVASSISPASAFLLPPQSQCVGKRRLTVEVRNVPGVRWLVATIAVNGRHFKTITRSQITRPVTLTGLPTGRFVLSITAKTTRGRVVSATRTYRPCASKVPAYTLTVALAGTGSGRVTGSGISCPGTCSHSYAAGTVVTLTAMVATSHLTPGTLRTWTVSLRLPTHWL